MNEIMPESAELITLFGDDVGDTMTKRDVMQAIRRMDRAEERGKRKGKDPLTRAKQTLANDALIRQLWPLQDKFIEAEAKLQGTSSLEGFFITPQVLAMSLWNSGISAGVQLNPSDRKEGSGFMPSFVNDGLDAFASDKEVQEFLKRDMEFLPIKNFLFDTIGGK